MPIVRAKEGERFDNLLRRFRKAVEKSGIMAELRKRECYEKPSTRKKRKAAVACKRAARQAYRENKD